MLYHKDMERFTVFSLEDYDEWFDSEPPKSKVQIQDRLSRIEDCGHFGTIRDLKEDVWELKFNDGRRIYYTVIPENNVILLLGGNKNGQQKDISKARKILSDAQKNET